MIKELPIKMKSEKPKDVDFEHSVTERLITQEAPAQVVVGTPTPSNPVGNTGGCTCGNNCNHPVSTAVSVSKSYSQDEISLLRNVVAKGCNDAEFKLLMYLASTYGLDPLAKQIWAVKRSDNVPALIFAGRDGMLAIAHRSGQFDGMQSGVVYEGAGKDKRPVSAWCEVWRKDMSHSFKTEVPFNEYNTGFSVWKSNPSAMIIKVAEAVCLRKAFSISGLYSPEEINHD